MKARKRGETDLPAAGVGSGEGRGLKGPEVTPVRLETGRSSPGQGEARGNPGGGPNRGLDVQIGPLTWG